MGRIGGRTNYGGFLLYLKLKNWVMNTIKNIFLVIGIGAVALLLVFLVLGVKVISTVFMYAIGAIAVICLVGYLIYAVGKASGKRSVK